MYAGTFVGTQGKVYTQTGFKNLCYTDELFHLYVSPKGRESFPNSHVVWFFPVSEKHTSEF